MKQPGPYKMLPSERKDLIIHTIGKKEIENPEEKISDVPPDISPYLVFLGVSEKGQQIYKLISPITF